MFSRTAQKAAAILMMAAATLVIPSPVAAAEVTGIQFVTETHQMSDDSTWDIVVDNYLAGFQPDDTAATVNRLYKGILGRGPDAEGLAYWVNQIDNYGHTSSEIAEQFVDSPEYKIVSGQPETFLTVLYSNILGRTPDGEGFDYWMGRWNDTGNTLKEAGEIAAWFTESPEHNQKLVDERYRYSSVRMTSEPVTQTTQYDPADPHASIHAMITEVFAEHGTDVVNSAIIISHCENSQHSPALAYTNTNRTQDVGIFQINTYYHKDQVPAAVTSLSQHSQQVWADTDGDLKAALSDPMFNIEIAEYIALNETWRKNGFSSSSWRSSRWGSWTCGKQSGVTRWNY